MHKGKQLEHAVTEIKIRSNI